MFATVNCIAGIFGGNVWRIAELKVGKNWQFGWFKFGKYGRLAKLSCRQTFLLYGSLNN